VLKVKDIVIHYNKVQAVKGVSLDVADGAIIALIGANGAGKSSVLRAISGMIRPTSGEIWYGEDRIDGLGTEKIVMKGIAHAPEGRMLFPYMTVLDTLRVGAYALKDRNEISKNLDMVYHHFVRLKERKNQLAGTLSGGEQQMLTIGRALMSSPKILLLDEPSLGLSPLLTQEIAKIIKEINAERGVTILLVEQNSRMALGLANFAYILEVGEVALQGDAKQLLNDDRVKEHYLGMK